MRYIIEYKISREEDSSLQYIYCFILILDFWYKTVIRELQQSKKAKTYQTADYLVRWL